MSDVQMTHSTDCWRWHHECAKRAVEELAIDKERFRTENERLAQCCAQRGARLQVIRESLLRIRPHAEYVTAWDQLLWHNQAAGISSWFDEDGVPVRRVSDE